MDPQRDIETTPPSERRQITSVEVAGLDFVFKTVELSDSTPTGSQIAAAAGYKPSQHVTVLRYLPNGELEDMRPLEQVRLAAGETNRFIVTESDRSLRLTIDGVRFDWPCNIITGAQLRKLGAVEDNKDLYIERRDAPDAPVEDLLPIDLSAKGVEVFYSRSRVWHLKVQDVLLEFDTPEVLVRDVLFKAKYDVTQAWHIFLKVAGQPKQVVTLTSVIDLRTKGIEKLRLTPKDINNGEVAQANTRHFSLLEVDEQFLDLTYPDWETVVEGPTRWLLIHSYPVPKGYNRSVVTLALNIPTTYPGAEVDMFYVHEPLSLLMGRPIPAATVHVDIQGKSYQRWSRHRSGATQWKPATDNIITHLALVDDCLVREVEP